MAAASPLPRPLRAGNAGRAARPRPPIAAAPGAAMSRAKFVGEGAAGMGGGFLSPCLRPGPPAPRPVPARGGRRYPLREGPRAEDGGSGCAVAGLVPALHPTLVASCSSPLSRVCPSPSGLLRSLRFVQAPLPRLVTSRPCPSGRACRLLRSLSVFRGSGTLEPPGIVWECLCCVWALGPLRLGYPQLWGFCPASFSVLHWHISRGCV